MGYRQRMSFLTSNLQRGTHSFAADGAMPEGNGSLGDVEKAARVFAINEILPVMEVMKGVNDWLGQKVIRFNPYALLKDE